MTPQSRTVKAPKPTERPTLPFTREEMHHRA